MKLEETTDQTIKNLEEEALFDGPELAKFHEEILGNDWDPDHAWAFLDANVREDYLRRRQKPIIERYIAAYKYSNWRVD